MNEKSIRGLPGMMMLLVLLALGASVVFCFIRAESTDNAGLAVVALVCMFTFFLMLSGFFVVEPNGSKVLLLFGKYVGTVKTDGFHWTNPFQTKRNMSLRVRTFNGEKLKVNDASGNPIEIAIVVVWRVVDTYAASFEVDQYDSYVHLQSETSLRHSAGTYPYDATDDQVSLRQNADEVSQHIKDELQSKLRIAWVEVLEARIAHLAYASEIAGAMLRRQQAAAVIAARQLIVDGAVGMVEQALERMDREKLINLDEDRKAAMISNLMVVLCSDHSAQPVVNTGSIY